MTGQNQGAREEQVVLVDIFDQALGSAEKLAAHNQGLLHRAFSIFLHDGERLLLQQRAPDKYHSGGLWANTCCSHRRPGEGLAEAAGRRLREETGIDCPLQPAFSFIYRHVFQSGLIEYELDHVLLGRYGGAFSPDPAEIQAMAYLPGQDLARQLLSQPGRFAPWFICAAPRVLALLGLGR
mgnify:FL=1